LEAATVTKNTPDAPPYKLHRGTSQGYGIFEGKRRYFGRHELPESKARYDQTVAEWLAAGLRTRVEASELTVVELVNAFRRHREAESLDKRDLGHFKSAWTPLVELYGETPAAALGPLKLKAVRERLIVAGKRPRCRGYVNRRTKAIRFIFRWAVAEELVPVAAYEALRAVPGLKRGKTDAAESEPVKPVPQEHVDAIRPYLSRQVEALIDLQLLTAARPGELVIMRPIDFDTTGKVWVYTPATHKTAYRGRKRAIYLGPRAQEVVRPFLAGRAVEAFLFSPAEAKVEQPLPLKGAKKPSPRPEPCGKPAEEAASRTKGGRRTAPPPAPSTRRPGAAKPAAKSEARPTKKKTAGPGSAPKRVAKKK
jgi:integrase